VEKYCRAQQVTDDSMAHANCMLDTLNITLYVNCLAFLKSLRPKVGKRAENPTSSALSQISIDSAYHSCYSVTN